MHHPYQCLAVARRGSGDILIAALGPQLLTFDVKNGQLLSQWPQGGKAKVHNRMTLYAQRREYVKLVQLDEWSDIHGV